MGSVQVDDVATGMRPFEPGLGLQVAEQACPNPIHVNEVGEGNFAAWQGPELFTSELWAAFNSPRRS